MIGTLKRNGRALALAWAVVVLVVLGVSLLPEGVDWTVTFRPASRAVLAGQSPYEIERARPYAQFFNPPWALIPLIPLALLPVALGRAVLVLVTLGAFAYSAHKLGAKPVGMAAFLLSPPALACILHGNVDWMPVLGFVLPPRWGLLLVMIKPQIGAVVALFWFVEAWREGGWRKAVATFAPVVLVTLVSFLFFGYWPANMFDPIDPSAESYSLAWNASLWPSTLPVGLAALLASLQHREVRYAMAAGPCLSPYVLLQSWSGALMAVVHMSDVTVPAVIGLWGVVVLRAMGGAL